MDIERCLRQNSQSSAIQWAATQPPYGASPLKPGSIARRWTVIASGLLLLALALIVLYTAPNAFRSPVALVVVAAIGLAALLLQLRFRQDLPHVHSPLWLNVLGLVCAILAIAADQLKLSPRALEVVSFGALACFGISGSLIFRALRQPRKTAD